jgi:hypothetical protein
LADACGASLREARITVIFSAIDADGPTPPFQIHVRIGKPITASGDAHLDLEELRAAVTNLMRGIPGLYSVPGGSEQNSVS